jgi:diguanylate cyclase
MVRPRFTLLLGSDRFVRRRTQLTLTASAVYVFSLLAQWNAVLAGRTQYQQGIALISLIVLGNFVFYAVARSKLWDKFGDQVLTMAQMVFALVAISIAYRINPIMRGILLMIVPLILVFGVFTLSPRRCRQLGWIAIALIGIAMMVGVLQDSVHFIPGLEAESFLFAAVTFSTISILAAQLSALRIAQYQQKRELNQALIRLNELATKDPLTGLSNRRHVHDWMALEVARGRRTGQPLSLAILDLDHFKNVNDSLGHSAGDEVLQIFAREARHVLRDTDMLARWGGEEFLVALPGMSTQGARNTLERLRQHMSQDTVWGACPQGRVTFSAGFAVILPPMGLEQALAAADANLYAAKLRGRDQIADDSLPISPN